MVTEFEKLMQDILDLEKDSTTMLQVGSNNKEKEKQQKGLAVRKQCLERMVENDENIHTCV